MTLGAERTGYDAELQLARSELQRIASVYAGLGQSEKWRDAYTPFDEDHLLQSYLRDLQLARTLRRLGYSDLSGLRILDIGRGGGAMLTKLAWWGAEPSRLYGLDISSERLSRAQLQCPSSTHLVQADGTRLPFADGTFDVVLQTYMLSASHATCVRHRLAAEMMRVLKSRGLLIHEDVSHRRVRNSDPYQALGIAPAEIARLYRGASVIAVKPLYAGRALRILLRQLLLVAGQMSHRIPVLSPKYLAVLRKTDTD